MVVTWPPARLKARAALLRSPLENLEADLAAHAVKVLLISAAAFVGASPTPTGRAGLVPLLHELDEESSPHPGASVNELLTPIDTFPAGLRLQHQHTEK